MIDDLLGYLGLIKGEIVRHMPERPAKTFITTRDKREDDENAMQEKEESAAYNLNNELLFNSMQLVFLLLELDVFSIINKVDKFARIIESCLSFLIYDRKNLDFLSSMLFA